MQAWHYDLTHPRRELQVTCSDSGMKLNVERNASKEEEGRAPHHKRQVFSPGAVTTRLGPDDNPRRSGLRSDGTLRDCTGHGDKIGQGSTIHAIK